MIIVDQMRAPRWLPSANTTTGSVSGQQALDNILPNIAAIRNNSYAFANYFGAATDCSPNRAALLTGLYSQQTCIFATQDPPPQGSPQYPPALQPWEQMVNSVLTPGQGFPCIGDVLSQPTPGPNYSCVWIGKWHLSDNPTESTFSCSVGGNGPSDYGFKDFNPSSNYSVPTPPGAPPPDSAYFYPYPSPNGDVILEGNSGNFGNLSGSNVIGLPAGDNDVPNYNLSGSNYPTYPALNDAAVADAFNKWITNAAPTSNKWFAAVSFLNPHDIQQFPFSFGL